MTAPAVPPPVRVVDLSNCGWYLTASGLYRADLAGQRDLPDRLQLDEIGLARGPWRRVVAASDDDEATLREVFDRAGRKAVATLAAALELVYHGLREARGGPANLVSHDYAIRTLTAGRAGNWEAALLPEVLWVGNAVNLARTAPGVRSMGIEEAARARRAAGPTGRVDRDGRDQLAAMVRSWVTDPGRYVEVPGTLAGWVARYADEVHGPAGWRRIADRWLQPGAPDRAGFAVCYRLFYGGSAHFDGGLLGELG